MPAAIEAVCTLMAASGCCAAAERQLNISTRLAMATTFMMVRRIDLRSFLSSYACSILAARVGLLHTPNRLAHLPSFRRRTPGTARPPRAHAVAFYWPPGLLVPAAAAARVD